MLRQSLKCAIVLAIVAVAAYAFGGEHGFAGVLPFLGMAYLGVSPGVSGRQINEYADQYGPGLSLRRPSMWAGANLLSPKSVANLPLRELDGMPIDEYLANVKPRVLDAVDYRHFDTRIIIAAQNITAGTYNWFQTASGGSEATLDASVTIPKKTPEYTNAIAAGTIEGANTLIVDSVQISLYFPHRDFNAFTSNSGLPSTGAPSATDTNSATNCLLALQQGMYFTFSQPNYPIFAEGKLADFPPDREINASFGGATPEGVIQFCNGPKYLRYVRVMQPLHNFTFQAQVFRTITMPLNAVIEVALCGIKLIG